MSDVSTNPLTVLGGQGVVCIGDVCEIPRPSEQAIVNNMLDNGEF
jgi:hypothetical protein